MSYAETVAKIKALREQAKNEAKEAFNAESANIFAADPKLESFSWRQYTPYFNDGEECVFSAHTSEITITYDGNEHEDVYLDGKQYGTPDDVWACSQRIKGLLEVFEEPDLKELFGDHVAVTVTKDGATADEYSHD